MCSHNQKFDNFIGLIKNLTGHLQKENFFITRAVIPYLCRRIRLKYLLKWHLEICFMCFFIKLYWNVTTLSDWLDICLLRFGVLNDAKKTFLETKFYCLLVALYIKSWKVKIILLQFFELSYFKRCQSLGRVGL